MTSENPPASFPAAEAIAAQFANELGAADEIRAAALAGLQRLREARANHAKREATRIQKERGRDDPDALQLQARAKSEASFSQDLAGEIKRVSAARRGDKTATATSSAPAAATTKRAPRTRKG